MCGMAPALAAAAAYLSAASGMAGRHHVITSISGWRYTDQRKSEKAAAAANKLAKKKIEAWRGVAASCGNNVYRGSMWQSISAIVISA